MGTTPSACANPDGIAIGADETRREVQHGIRFPCDYRQWTACGVKDDALAPGSKRSITTAALANVA